MSLNPLSGSDIQELENILDLNKFTGDFGQELIGVDSIYKFIQDHKELEEEWDKPEPCYGTVVDGYCKECEAKNHA